MFDHFRSKKWEEITLPYIFSSFLLSSSLSKHFAQLSSSKTKCGILYPFSLKSLFGLHNNPISHFWHFSHLLVFISLSLIIYFTLALKLIIKPLGPHFSKFQICPFSLAFISGFNQFLNLAYNIQSYAHIFISHLSFSQFNNLSIFLEKPKFGSILYPEYIIKLL